MAFEMSMSVCEHCEEIVVSDTTGAYNATTNPGGYGGPGAPADPDDFTSMVLGVWYPGSDQTGDPDFTLNLLPAPSPDSDGYYSWTIAAADLPADFFVSGIWYLRITAVYSGTTYYADVTSLFVKHMDGIIDTAMNKAHPGCSCGKDGQVTPYDLLDVWTAAKKHACCGDWIDAQKNVNWLYRNYKSICC